MTEGQAPEQAGIRSKRLSLDESLDRIDHKIAQQEARIREQEARVTQLELIARAHGLLPRALPRNDDGGA